MSQSVVDLVIEQDAWRDAVPDLAEIAERSATLALAEIPPEHRSVEICVMACDDARIAELNDRFRDKSAATNVLSWPAFELAPDNAGGRPDLPPVAERSQGPVHLGDVALSLETIVSEAKAASMPLKNHVLHLILHGVLHLLGYDHIKSEDAELMEGIETRALALCGIPDPYV